jgi:hypothetical protein
LKSVLEQVGAGGDTWRGAAHLIQNIGVHGSQNQLRLAIFPVLARQKATSAAAARAAVARSR